MRAKSESEFEDVSRSIFIDFVTILVSILGPKIDKKRSKNQANFGSDFGCDFGRFLGISASTRGRIGVARGRPGGRGEAAGALNSLTESDKS